MKLGILLFVSGMFFIATAFVIQQMGIGFEMISSFPRRPGPIEILISFWPGPLVLGIGLVIGGIVRIIIKTRNSL